MKKLLLINEMTRYNFAYSEKQYPGWEELPKTDQELNRLIEEYEETVTELEMLRLKIDYAILRCDMEGKD
jgi:hypothetical protein